MEINNRIKKINSNRNKILKRFKKEKAQSKNKKQEVRKKKKKKNMIIMRELEDWLQRKQQRIHIY